MARSSRRPLVWCSCLLLLGLFYALLQYAPKAETHDAGSAEVKERISVDQDFPHTGYYRAESEEANGQMPLQVLLNPLPRMQFSKYAGQPPLNLQDESGNVFALLLCSRQAVPGDPAFAATQQTVFRLLWQFRSIHQVVVFVCPWTPQKHRNVLLGQGAMVKELKEWPNMDAKSDALAAIEAIKLQMWNATEFQKIAFLGSDAVPMANIDDIFETVQGQQTVSEASMSGSQNAEVFAITDNFDTSFMVFSPSQSVHQGFLQAASQVSIDAKSGLSTFLRSDAAFGTGSARTVQILPKEWNFSPDGVAMTEESLAQVKVLRARIWDSTHVSYDPLLRDIWDLSWLRQCRWYDGVEFWHARETGVYRSEFSIFVETMNANEEGKDGE